VSSSLSVVVLFSDISRALYRVVVSTFPEINILSWQEGQVKRSIIRFV
jgi:hypothetical protein